MAILTRSHYSPALGGHGPNDVRDAFLEAIEACFLWKAGEPEPTVELRDAEVSIRVLCVQLWNCSDFLAGSDAMRFELLCGSRAGTYGSAARALKPWVVAQSAS